MKEKLEQWSEFLNKITRPHVTTVVIYGVTYGFLTGLVNSDAFLTLVGAVVGFWFKEREDAKAAVSEAREAIKAEEVKKPGPNE